MEIGDVHDDRTVNEGASTNVVHCMSSFREFKGVARHEPHCADDGVAPLERRRHGGGGVSQVKLDDSCFRDESRLGWKKNAHDGKR